MEPAGVGLIKKMTDWTRLFASDAKSSHGSAALCRPPWELLGYIYRPNSLIISAMQASPAL